ncbi:MAG: prohibitin family protein [bacterium]
MKNNLKILGVVLVVLIFLVALTPVTIVNAGDRGVVLVWSAFTGKVLEPGIHFRMPIVERIVHIDVQTQKIEQPTVAYSKDMQQVNTKLALNYHPDVLQVGRLYQDIGLEYEDRIVKPAIEEAVKQATANFTAEELISRRAEVKDKIKLALVERLTPRFMVIDEFSITDFSFSDQFEAAVEAKQVAEQQALKAKNDLDRITIEAQQSIETAKAQAESIRIQANALAQNKELINLKAVEKWNGVLPVYMLSGAMPFLNIK